MQFLIHMSIIWICVTSRVRPAILIGKNLYAGHYTQTVQPDFFIPAMLVGTSNFCHFIPLSLWPWPYLGVTRSALSEACRFHFLPHFSSDSGWDVTWCWSNFSLTTWDWDLSKICWNKGNLVWWQRPLSSTCWYQFGWPWPSSKVTVVWEIKELWCPFSRKM